MTTLTLPNARPLNWLGRAWQLNRPLTLLGLLMVATFAATLVGIIVDPQVITGTPAWVKPAKFAISVAIYSFTFVWLLTFVQGRRRLVALAANVTAATLLIEMLVIVGQVLRGTTSHFNVSTPLNATLWSTMAFAIITLWFAGLLLAGLLLVQRLPDAAFAWSLRLGMLVALVGMALAFLMTSGPTPTQLAAMEAGGPATTIGAHSVGVEDGGPGLPFVGWSTIGGDLRVAHFVGLHALQVMPLAGWLLARLGLGMRRRLGLVWVTGLGYLGLTLLLAWQALRGQSLIAPDGLTLGVLAALVASVLVAAVVVGRLPEPKERAR